MRGTILGSTAARVALAGVLALPAFVLAPAARAADVREEVVRAFVDGHAIEVTLYRPAGPGPHPLAVLSHGSPRSAAARRQEGRIRFETQGHAFVAKGFAVAVPTRRGYGESGGEWAEGYGRCDDPDYEAAGRASARDLRAAIDALRGDAGIDTGRIVLVGQSAGGWASLAAASEPLPGLAAVVNFAGGRGSRGPDDVCGEERLVVAAAAYGRSSSAPQLWVYTENDRFFRPALSRRMHEAFVASGGRAKYVLAPAFGTDGHAYFARATAHWMPEVDAFLASQGLGARR